MLVRGRLAAPEPRRQQRRPEHEHQPETEKAATGHVVVLGDPLPRQAEDEPSQPDLERDGQHHPQQPEAEKLGRRPGGDPTGAKIGDEADDQRADQDAGLSGQEVALLGDCEEGVKLDWSEFSPAIRHQQGVTQAERGLASHIRYQVVRMVHEPRRHLSVGLLAEPTE